MAGAHGTGFGAAAQVTVIDIGAWRIGGREARFKLVNALPVKPLQASEVWGRVARKPKYKEFGGRVVYYMSLIGMTPGDLKTLMGGKGRQHHQPMAWRNRDGAFLGKATPCVLASLGLSWLTQARHGLYRLDLADLTTSGTTT